MSRFKCSGSFPPSIFKDDVEYKYKELIGDDLARYCVEFSTSYEDDSIEVSLNDAEGMEP